MKKFLMGALCVGLVSLMADSTIDLKGQIPAIDSNAKTIVMTSMKGAVLVQIIP